MGKLKRITWICFCIILTCSISGFSQIAYYDAMALKDSIPKDGGDSNKIKYFTGIIKKYLPEKWRDSSANAILKSLGNEKTNYNPFIYPLTKGAISGVKANLKLPQWAPDKIPPVLAGNFYNLDVTTIARGISLFMIDRAKQELSIAFFDRMKSFFEKNKEVRLLFPQTAGVLVNLSSYRYPEMLPALRSAFYDDLQAWPRHIDNIFCLPEYEPLIEQFPEIRLFLKSIELAELFQSERSDPIALIEEFAALDIGTRSNAGSFLKNAGNSIRLANIVSLSLRTADKDGGWVDPAQIRILFKDTVAFKIYLGLLYQQVSDKNIAFINPERKNKDSIVYFRDAMERCKEDINFYQNILRDLIAGTDRFMKMYKEIKIRKKSGQKAQTDDYCRYIESGYESVECFFAIAGRCNVKMDLFNNTDYTGIARAGLDIYRNIYRNDNGYALKSCMAVFDKSLSIAEAALNKKADRYKSDLKKIAIDSLKKPVALKVKSCEDTVNTIKKLAGIFIKISTYGAFMANVADAKSPDEVKNAIETAALPAGSSSIKKGSSFDLCVQSYLGVYGGRLRNERIEKRYPSWSNHYGCIAPIGVALSTKIGRKGKWGSASVFGSMFDIGAIIDYDLKTDTTNATVKKEYKVQLGQLFSPGAYIAYGFLQNIPLTLGFGGQYGPGLGTIEAEGETVINNPSWRWNAFLAVDIPLLELYNRE
jgi:hypothetical protein